MSAHGVEGPGGGVRPDRRENERPSRPDLRLVEAHRERAVRRSRRARLAVLGAGTFIAVVVFGLVGLHVMLAQNQFRLDRINSQTAAEEARYQRLRLEVDQLESPSRIVATAEGKLGMVPPANVTYLTPSAPAAPGAAGGGVFASPSATVPSAGSSAGDWAAVKPKLVAAP